VPVPVAAGFLGFSLALDRPLHCKFEIGVILL